MNNQCPRRGPVLRGQCSKLSWNEHTEHHCIETGERWIDADVERVLEARRTQKRGTRDLGQIEISKMYAQLKARHTTVSRDLLTLQEVCAHPTAGKKRYSDTGNYDRSDEYWTEFKCPDCGKCWTVTGSL